MISLNAENEQNKDIITEKCSINKYLQLKMAKIELYTILPIDKHELEHIKTIQEQIKAESGIKKSLVEIAGWALKIALSETVKTCNIGDGK